MKVILHKLFPYAPYLNEYIGFEDEVGESESVKDAVIRLRGYAEQAHRERYPHLYPKGNEAIVPGFQQQPLPEIDYKKKEETEKAIDNCTSFSELNLLNADALKYGLIEHFVNRITSLKLQNPTI
jgi:hypothetical protein